MVAILCTCLSCATNFDEWLLYPDPRLKSIHSSSCKHQKLSEENIILSRIRRHNDESQPIQSPQRIPRIAVPSSQQNGDFQNVQPPPSLFPFRSRQVIQSQQSGENQQRQSQGLKNQEKVSTDEIQQVVQDNSRQRKYNTTGEVTRKPYGASQRFCDMFGCDCVPPPNAKCCKGYMYDKRSEKCREVF
ncbi:hypothetical protein NPIL_88801 [Nephila pilipes]|uniref:Uncharacterized protein n=1 Tax=Nephila pilipes TaxID=299642 RepID=A0A8X6TCR0_NEPPI|nr:hypothetical protein NPIL_88801 [Nephila pilipes]